MSRQVLTYPDLPDLSLQYLPLAGGNLTGNLGFDQVPEANWHADWAVARFGKVGVVRGDNQPTSVTLAISANNVYTTALENRSIVAGGSTLQVMSANQWLVYTAPSVAAGAVQAFTPKLNMNLNGTIALTPDATYPALTVQDGVALAVGGQASPWDLGYDVIQFPNQAIFCNGAAANTLEIGCNTYVNGGVRKALVGSLGATLMHFQSNNWSLHSAPLVAANAQQTFALRASLDGSTGTFRFWPVPGNWCAFFGQSVGPETDNFANLGYGSNRWIGVYATIGTINTSSREVKEIVGTVNDSVALEQLMGLPAIYRFHYKHQQDDPENEGQYITVTDTSKEFIGPVAEEMPMDMKVGDEVTVGSVNTEGHLMASLRGAVKEYRWRLDQLTQRIAALEGRMPA